MIKISAKNSHSSKISIHEESKKQATRNKSENMGCCATTTIRAQIIKEIEKI
jgi:hypothetical protein